LKEGAEVSSGDVQAGPSGRFRRYVGERGRTKRNAKLLEGLKDEALKRSGETWDGSSRGGLRCGLRGGSRHDRLSTYKSRGAKIYGRGGKLIGIIQNVNNNASLLKWENGGRTERQPTPKRTFEYQA